jgi:hypothetical protein
MFHNQTTKRIHIGLMLHRAGQPIAFNDDGDAIEFARNLNFSRDSKQSDTDYRVGKGIIPRFVRDGVQSFLKNGWDINQGMPTTTDVVGYGEDAVKCEDSAEFQAEVRAIRDADLSSYEALGPDWGVTFDMHDPEGALRRVTVKSEDMVAMHRLLYFDDKAGDWRKATRDGVTCFGRLCAGMVQLAVAAIIAEQRTRGDKAAIDTDAVLKRLIKVPVLTHHFKSERERVEACVNENTKKVGKRDLKWLDYLKAGQEIFSRVKAERAAAGKTGPVPEAALKPLGTKGTYERVHKILMLNDLHPDLRILDMIRAKKDPNGYVAGLKTNDLRNLIPGRRKNQERPGATGAQVLTYLKTGKEPKVRSNSGAELRTFARDLGDVLGGILFQLSQGRGADVRAAILASLEARDLTVTDLDAGLRDLLGITFVLDIDEGKCEMEVTSDVQRLIAERVAAEATAVAE